MVNSISEPPYFDEAKNCWIVNSYHAGRFVLENDAHFTSSAGSDEATTEYWDDSGCPVLNELFHQLLFLDGKTHRRIRSAIEAPLFPQVRRLRPYIERVVAVLLETADGRDEVDIQEDFATPLTLLTLARALGLNEICQADSAAFGPRDLVRLRPKLRRLETWSGALADLTTGFFSMEAVELAGQMHTYFFQLLKEKQKWPGDDLASAYAASGQLGAHEGVINTMMLFGAGNVTTTTLITNTIPMLLPDAADIAAVRSLLCEDPARITGLVHELLRLVTPTQYVSRFACRNIMLAGVRISKADKIEVNLAAMNRDPAMFDTAGRLDVHRQNSHRHVAFGAGCHRCPGAPLALLEAGVGFRSLFARPNLQMLPGRQPEMNLNENQRRYVNTRVTWS